MKQRYKGKMAEWSKALLSSMKILPPTEDSSIERYVGSNPTLVKFLPFFFLFSSSFFFPFS